MTIESSIRQINGAVLDLQNSEYNTYSRPLERLNRILTSEPLKGVTDDLKDGLDFDAFLADANSGGSMIGSANLNWPTDPEKELGLTLILIDRGASDPRWFLELAYTYYNAGSKYIESIRRITSSAIIPFARDFAEYLRARESKQPLLGNEHTDSNRVFIVHGHDEAPREKLARFIEKLGLLPVILHEQANLGMTVIEKLIANGNVGYAIVLLTPDDLGRPRPETEEKPRARQNVILELGYFLGRLGRENVMALLKDDVEIPSDYMGVMYVKFDDAGAWRQDLVREMNAVGYEIDWNTAM